jgi:hypothetical protein
MQLEIGNLRRTHVKMTSEINNPLAKTSRKEVNALEHENKMTSKMETTCPRAHGPRTTAVLLETCFGSVVPHSQRFHTSSTPQRLSVCAGPLFLCRSFNVNDGSCERGKLMGCLL